MPDTATAYGSYPTLCVERVCPGSMPPFYWWLLYWITHSLCGLLFGEMHAELEV